MSDHQLTSVAPQFAAVLFDLDGTLLDTAPDLGAAANHVLASLGRPPLDEATIYSTASDGALALLKAGIPEPEQAQYDLALLRQQFLDYYAAHLCVYTRPFAGIVPFLHQLDAHHIPWGIVTNKPDFLTRPLIAQLPDFSQCAVIVSADTLPVRKPNPEPLWYACQQINCSSDQTLYIGDHYRDILAGQNAGMPTMIAGWGYLKPDEHLSEWKADYILDTPHKLTEWFPFR